MAKKQRSNRFKSWVFAALAVLAYSIPLITLAIIKSDKIFKNASTSLTVFSVVILIFFIVFFKKTIKRICGITTTAGFVSIILLVLAVALRNFLDDLFIIALASVIGAVLAWFPTQIGKIFSKYAYDTNGNLRADLTVRRAAQILFGVAISTSEE